MLERYRRIIEVKGCDYFALEVALKIGKTVYLGFDLSNECLGISENQYTQVRSLISMHPQLCPDQLLLS